MYVGILSEASLTVLTDSWIQHNKINATPVGFAWNWCIWHPLLLVAQRYYVRYYRTTSTSHTLQGKVEAAQRELQHSYIIVADTLVADPDNPKKAFGQPSDVSEALQMLLHLSGRRHRVWSGSAIICGDDVRSWVESATVEIEPLSDEIIEALIHSGSWRGKAGGYDLGDAMGQFGKVVDGDEICVLGFAGSLLAALAND